MMGLTGSFMLMELVVGHLTNSTLLIADSFHMLCDVLAAGVALLCIRYCLFTISLIYFLKYFSGELFAKWPSY
jgi:Co/Zn/Cd efflux system component